MTQHQHEWKEEGNYFVCLSPECGIRRLKLIDSPNKEGLLEGVRDDNKKYSVRKSRSRVFIPSEWERFYSFLKEKQKFTAMVLINTGARINEARNIRVEDIDFENKKIILKVIKRRNDYTNGKIRTIPISESFSKILKDKIIENNLGGQDYLGLLSTCAFNIGMKKALILSGITDWYNFSAHNIRKTLETWLVALNQEELKVLAHMGHNKSTALRHYIVSDTFSQEEKTKIRDIIGNLYYDKQEIDKLSEEVKNLNDKIQDLYNK